jgi:hypothetical protein
MKNAVPSRAHVASGRQPTGNRPRAHAFVSRWALLLCGSCVAFAGCAAHVAPAPTPAEIAAAAPPPPVPYSGPTIPKLLGIPECVAVTKSCAETICTCLKRQFPGPGAAAPNLGEVGPGSAPAVKCAAEIIEAEAAAPQKIDALRYLGKVGCTKCYPCVEEGLVAALDDCTEVVRFEAAKAIRATASEECGCCRYTSCCTQKVFEKLYKVAYETRCDGCPVEPSPRVRRVARQALQMCGGPIAVEEPEEPVPSEGPSGALPPPAGETAPPPTEQTAGPLNGKPDVSPAATPVNSKTPAVTPVNSKTSAASESKEVVVPTDNTDDTKSTAGVRLHSGPELPAANRIAIPAAVASKRTVSQLRLLPADRASDCEACGAQPANASGSPNPFRTVR